MSNTLFHPGRVLGTAGAFDIMAQYDIFVTTILDRHLAGDWGDVCDDYKEANARALTHGGLLVSCYEIAPDVTLWVITEADRSITTILLPEEH